VLIEGVGEGCDYSPAGCNRGWQWFDGCTSMDDAINMLKTMLAPTGDPDDDKEFLCSLNEIERAKILEVQSVHDVNLEELFQSKEKKDAKLAAEKKKRTEDLAEIERLKLEYPEQFGVTG